MSESTVSYDTYFQHGLPDRDAMDRHWTGERYNADLAALGVSNPELTDRDVAQIRFPYMQASRHLHIEEHPIEVGAVQPNKPLQERLTGTRYENWELAAAVMRLSADAHDVAYKNVDADPQGRNAWPSQVRRLINGMADWQIRVQDGERHYETFLTEKGKADELTRIVAYLFELPEDGVLSHKTGGSNEFDSALAMVQFLKQHAIEGQKQPIERVDIIAVAAIIAATIPFRPNASADERGTLAEGFMEQLGRRVHKVLLDIGEDPHTAYRTTNAIMAMGVCVANRDTAPFTRPDNASALTSGARKLRAEELVVDGRHIFREPVTTMSGLTRAARLISSAPGLYEKIMRGLIQPDTVPKFVVPFDDDGQLIGIEHSYPPQAIHAQAAGNVKENVGYSRDFFLIHEVGIVAGRVLLRHAGELDSEVPGAVKADVWLTTMQPTGEHFDRLQSEGGKALTLYQELSGITQHTGLDLVPRKSPLSALVLGAAGLAGAIQLSDIVQRHWEQFDATKESDPYFDTVRAEEFRSALLEYVGPHNYNAILDVLILAADFYDKPKRLAALEQLKVPS